MTAVTVPGPAGTLPATAPTRVRTARAAKVDTEPGRPHKTSTVGKITVWSLAVLWSIPTIGLLISSFRPELQIKTTGWWKFFSHPQLTLQNYKDVLAGGSGGGQLGTYFLNSVRITLPGTVIPVFLAAFAAYGFAWMRFKGRNVLFMCVIAMLVVPLQMALIPLLRLFTGGAHLFGITIFPDLGLSNSVVTVWLAHTCFALPLAIFLLYAFISRLPRELMEAARVDGATHLTIFWKIVVPLAVPAIASLIIFQFLWVWNDLLVGQVFGGGSKAVAPMTVRLVDLVGTRGNEWQRLTAGAFVAMAIPLLVFFTLQRFFVRGLVAGAVKG